MTYEIHPNYLMIEPLVKDIETYFQESKVTLYNKRNEIRVVEYEGEKYVVKSFRIPNYINQFVYRYFRPSKAKRSYQYSKIIGEILSPAAVAYREDSHLMRLTNSYYISTFFDYDFTINALLLDNKHEDYKKILEQFADFTYTLHGKNILHNDYSHGNILIKKNGGNYQFKVIDVNRMEFRSLSHDERLKNFCRLSANDEVMKVVIYRYASHIGIPEDEALRIATMYRDKFMEKRRLKNKLRGR